MSHHDGCCGSHHHVHDEEEPSSTDDAAELEEMNHFYEIVDSFANYRNDSLASLSDSDKRTRAAIDINTLFTDKIVEIGGSLFGPRRSSDAGNPLPRNISKVRSTLKQFVREWSSEGKAERDSCFVPIIEALKSHLPIGAFVVCPGSGLGRLPYEIAKAGFDAQGNEFSYHMILGSYLLLNGDMALTTESIALFPFALNYSDSVSDQTRLRAVKIPDEVPATTSGRMSMCAGEFVEVYEKQGIGFADGVVTCFFIDTAKNIMLYIRTIAGMIRQDGIWVNIGPLLFHYAEQDDSISVELCWEEIRELIQTYFTIEQEEYPVECVYSSNCESLFATKYNCVFFVAKRNNVELNGFSNPVFDI